MPHNYFMPFANNPLSKLNGESFNSLTSSGKPNDLACSGTLTPNSPPSSTNLYRNLTCTTGSTVDFSPGTYFFYNADNKPQWRNGHLHPLHTVAA